MSDADERLRHDVELALPAVRRKPDWDDVVSRARRGRTRRGAVVLAFAAAVLLLGTTALAETVGPGFSAWLRGEPGTPASGEDRQLFEERNERSAAPLVPQTDLRQLIEVRHSGRSYRLVGFRTGGAACLRLEGTDIAEGGDVDCVSGDELERSGDLAVPLRVDANLRETGSGDPPSDNATFGFVASETRRVILEEDDDEREATVANGAFLSISSFERRTLRGHAVDEDGVRHAIPLAPSKRADATEFRTGLPMHGPDMVDRSVRGGRIGWLERREPRGEPLRPELTQHSPMLPPLAFGRVVVPDPDDFIRIGLGIPAGEPEKICFLEFSRGGTGGGCNPPFARGPFGGGWTYLGVGAQFVVYAGMASDDVSRIELFLGTGERRRVALRDNVFVVRASRAKFPARLVAYDTEGRVIGVETTRAF